MFPAHAHISKDSQKNLNDGAAKEAAKLGREALGNAGDVSASESLVGGILSPLFLLDGQPGS
jgi:hypothetical protein